MRWSHDIKDMVAQHKIILFKKEVFLTFCFFFLDFLLLSCFCFIVQMEHTHRTIYNMKGSARLLGHMLSPYRKI